MEQIYNFLETRRDLQVRVPTLHMATKSPLYGTLYATSCACRTVSLGSASHRKRGSGIAPRAWEEASPCPHAKGLTRVDEAEFSTSLHGEWQPAQETQPCTTRSRTQPCMCHGRFQAHFRACAALRRGWSRPVSSRPGLLDKAGQWHHPILQPGDPDWLFAALY